MITESSSELLSRPTFPVAAGASEFDVPPTPERGPATRSPFSWPYRFFERGPISYVWENSPWIKCLSDFDSPEDAISFFLRNGNDSTRNEAKTVPILDIFDGIISEDIFEDPSRWPAKKVAWLIDGNYSEKGWNLRPIPGALSAPQLMEELSKDRFLDADETWNDWEIQRKPVDAERRLIYITDLDQWTILALVKTAPESQARLIADFFHKHICCRSSIGVSFASEGPPMFNMEFHFPFRVWRSSNQLLLDERIRSSDSTPLRSSRDVTFLDSLATGSENQIVHGIYSGHVGFIISGYDQSRWTAYFAIDTWFDDSEDINDKVTRYEIDREDGMEWDPLSAARDDSHHPVWAPRLYFLRIVSVRLEQVKDEWEVVRQRLDSGIASLNQRQKALFSRIRPFSVGSDQENYGLEFEALEEYLGGLKEILQGMLRELQEIRKTGDRFLATDVNFFLNYDRRPDDASACYPFLSEIRRRFNELGQLHIFFSSLGARTDDMIQNFEAARRKYFFHPGSGKDDPLDDPQNLRDIRELRIGLTKVADELKELRTDRIDQAASRHPVLDNTPTRFQLMSLFLRTPVPYFWAFTAFVNPSNQFLDDFPWRWLFVLSSILVLLVILGYACWLLSISSLRSRTIHLPTDRLDDCSSQRRLGLQDWFMERIHLMMGGLTIFYSRVQDGSHDFVVSGSSSGNLETTGIPGDASESIYLTQRAVFEDVAHIPVCLAPEKASLWKLEQISSKDCGDDRSFFLALRALVEQKRGRTCLGVMSSMGFRKPVGIHYVKFALCGGGCARILGRLNTFPPRTNPAIYRPSHSPGCPDPLVESDVLLGFYDSPPSHYDGRRDILEKIIHKINGPFSEDQSTGLGYGLEIEEGPDYHRFAIARLLLVFVSLLFGTAWAWKTGDIQGGFSIAGLLAIVSAMSVTTMEVTTASRRSITSAARYSAEMV